MKRCDRALKRKGYKQVSSSVEGAIHTTSTLKNKKGEVVRTIDRWWHK